ncbi:hypothetical protein K9L97_03040 [Candidatus Woesearchaeota archaeon]|nr:hypothetical protein [Candidatus Woesearchaeota archaeon]
MKYLSILVVVLLLTFFVVGCSNSEVDSQTGGSVSGAGDDVSPAEDGGVVEDEIINPDENVNIGDVI